MSDTPKFEVIDRRKIKAEEEHEHAQKQPEPAAAPPETPAGPRLVVPESAAEPAAKKQENAALDEEALPEMPEAPSAEESRQQKSAYDASAQRLEDLVRAQNPGVGPQPAVGFEHLVQQLYLSAMIQMGAGAQEGQRPRVDIMGARQTIDMLGVLAEKTKGNLSELEDRTLQTALFDVRMAFLELTNMISMQGVQPPPPRETLNRGWKVCSHFWALELPWGFLRWGAAARCVRRPIRTTAGCVLRCCCAGMRRAGSGWSSSTQGRIFANRRCATASPASMLSFIHTDMPITSWAWMTCAR